MRPNRKIRTLLITGLLLFVALLIAVPYFSSSSHPTAEIVPNPNGYDDFVIAGKLVQEDILNQKTNTIQQIKTCLSSNHVALDYAHAAFSKECATPTEYSDTYIRPHIDQLKALKQIAWALYLEGKLAQMEGRPGDAAQDYLTVIKMGSDIAHKGIVIDGMNAFTFQRVGSQNFESLIPTLNAEQCRKTIAALAKIDREQEPVENILCRERYFAWSEIRSPKRFIYYLRTSLKTKSFNPAKRYASALQWQFANLRKINEQLEILLAKRAYELEKNIKPDKWSDLVPAYLREIPTDPTTGAPLPLDF